MLRVVKRSMLLGRMAGLPLREGLNVWMVCVVDSGLRMGTGILYGDVSYSLRDVGTCVVDLPNGGDLILRKLFCNNRCAKFTRLYAHRFYPSPCLA